ncbi:serine/threonine-protein kinase MHK [Argentina anserina]|uniref:serine/threonine-protein kinase MHK n=1 Tax=Argentina anserina TaxID=57926 RepID=UPI0021763CE5|nr:serine/threonine-protein kinase MHK [Potentilla anserina]XP_050364013.1 serine/threonine-protein kinase MHK [Potentilla anserina]XP_050364014.1 serine/threonine-protein kinase MHK [Potentilla anserina]
MERYKILEELGDGTCGSVYKARDWRTNEIVAVKKMKRKFFFWEEYWRLQEIKVLRKLNHPNIIKLKEVIRENNEVFLIFEYMNYNLYEIMKERQRPFSEDEIRSFMSQLLDGLNHMHRRGYFHRDLKPENLLVTNDILKVADFGLAREVSSTPPYTEYVSTRWYRAPEVLLQAKSYTPAVDMWAAGAILAELFTLSPIFPGESEIDQLYKICRVLGTPDLTIFPEGTNISRLFGIINFEKILPADLSDIIPTASAEAIDLITKLCTWDPSKRPTSDETLQHPFFHVVWVHRSLHDPLDLKLSNTGTKPTLELKLSDFGAEPEDCFLGLTLAVKPSVPDFDVVHDVSQHIEEDALFCSGLEDHSARSVFWSLMPPGQGGICAPVEPSFSLSFSSIQHPSVRVPQSAGYPMPSLQSNIADGPLLAMSSPFQQSHWH